MPSADRLLRVPVIETPKGSDGTAAEAVASFWENLLPTGGGRPRADERGVYVGEALPPVPRKLADKIQAWEFTEMTELLPEFWAQKLEEKEGQPGSGSSRRKRPVTDLKTWLQCFAIYVGVLSAKHPEAVPELMSYMVAIIRASEDYAGLAWVRYDAAYRRQAAANYNRKWSRINPSLFSLCFTGKAQIANRCDLCLAASHATKDCALVAEGDPDLPSRLKAVESAVAAFSQTGGLSSVDRRLQGPPRRTQDEVCRVWNEKRCYFRRCRFRHVCSTCAGNHPVVECPLGGSGGGPARRPPYYQPARGPSQPPQWDPYNQGRRP